MRPKFEVHVPLSADEVMQRLRTALAADGCRVSGPVAKRHAELAVAEGEAHFWSPHLGLDVSDDGGGAKIYGRYGPHPHVWTLFVLFYAIVTFGSLFGLMFGISQWISEQPAWGLWSAPIGGVAALVIYLAALFGQRLGDDQMALLRELVNGALGEAYIP